ncbi:MAG: hypothetical protein ABIN99_12890 [Nitrosospira sp.]
MSDRESSHGRFLARWFTIDRAGVGRNRPEMVIQGYETIHRKRTLRSGVAQAGVSPAAI